MRPVYVRPATDDDVPFILSQLPHLQAVMKTEYSLISPNPGQAEATIRGFIRGGEQGFRVWIAEHWVDDDLEECRAVSDGFMVLQLAPHPFHQELMMCSTILWWVCEHARFTAAAVEMLEAFVRFARNRAQWVNFACNVNTRLRPESLLRYGFKPAEQCYLMEVHYTDRG